jgi:hypothetical protein
LAAPSLDVAARRGEGMIRATKGSQIPGKDLGAVRQGLEALRSVYQPYLAGGGRSPVTPVDSLLRLLPGR